MALARYLLKYSIMVFPQSFLRIFERYALSVFQLGPGLKDGQVTRADEARGI